MGSQSAKVGNHRAGHTLLELVLALGIMAMLIVPLLQLLPPALKLNTYWRAITVVTFLATQKTDETLAFLHGNFFAAPAASGTFSGDGHPKCRFTLTIADEVPNRLKNITVTVWSDENGNAVLDADEAKSTLATRFARRYP